MDSHPALTTIMPSVARHFQVGLSGTTLPSHPNLLTSSTIYAPALTVALQARLFSIHPVFFHLAPAYRKSQSMCPATTTARWIFHEETIHLQ